jgi:hypothetical protein
MKPEVPEQLLRQAGEWDELHRWERRELGKALRRLGLTYSEIRLIIPVPKGTLSNWCQELKLTKKQIEAIRARVPSQKGIPKDSQWRRRLEIERIRSEAERFAIEHCDDAFFVAGVVLYWAEGSKWRNDFAVANTDPAALRLFVAWVRSYLNRQAEFRLSLHLHHGNSERLAKSYWRFELGLPNAKFTKTYIKPRGTGHRKNRVVAGVCRVRVLRCADNWNRVMAWIEVVGDHMGSDVATLAPGR